MQGLFLSQVIARFSTSFLLAIALVVVAGCSANSGGSSGSATTPTGTAPVASLQMTGSPTAVKSDDSDVSAVTVTAVDANNATVSGATVTLYADTGLLNSQTVVTDTTGKATVNFHSGTANKANRTANITATAGTATASIQVQIVGSKLVLTTSTTSVPSTGASPATLTITAQDAGGSPISGATVTMTQSAPPPAPPAPPPVVGAVTFNPATGITDASGKLVVSVAGATIGTVAANATGVGATATQNYTIAASSSTFGINQLTLNPGAVVSVPTNPKTTAMHIGDSLVVQAAAPTSSNVIFSTTIGNWNGVANQSAVLVAVSGGIASATLTSTSAGLADVQVLDFTNQALSDTLTVGITATIPASIQLQASPTVIPLSKNSTVGYSNLNAVVLDATGAPVGGAPVAFSIVSGGTSSGETVSPVVVFSAATTVNGLALGAAPTTFQSGTQSSGQAGVQIRASVVGSVPLISTQTIGLPNTSIPTSSYDAAIVVGGTAGSVAIGQAAQIIDAGLGSTIYQLPMSVLVADSNGNPAPLGTVVNISVWPIAWTSGSRSLGCDPDPDGKVWGDTGLVDFLTGAPIYGYIPGNGGTFYNEDINENLVLDSGEDGTRKFYATGTTTNTLATWTLTAAGTKDSQITPLNSWGGTVASTNPLDLPGTATTDATGLATFNLTYPKSSAYWITSRVRAQTVVQGSPAVGQVDVPLPASVADSSSTHCYLPKSPFKF